MRSKVIPGAALLLAACSAHHGTPNAPTPEAVVPCAVPVASADSLDWKLVQAKGFTFCVPQRWQSSGARGWRGDGSSIEWTVGSPPRSAEAVRRVPVGIGVNEPPPTPLHFVEVIGGESAELWHTHLPNTDYTSANWWEKRVYFRGEARGPRMADVELMIYRTVRFSDADLGS